MWTRSFFLSNLFAISYISVMTRPCIIRCVIIIIHDDARIETYLPIFTCIAVQCVSINTRHYLVGNIFVDQIDTVKLYFRRSDRYGQTIYIWLGNCLVYMPVSLYDNVFSNNKAIAICAILQLIVQTSLVRN